MIPNALESARDEVLDSIDTVPAAATVADLRRCVSETGRVRPILLKQIVVACGCETSCHIRG